MFKDKCSFRLKESVDIGLRLQNLCHACVLILLGLSLAQPPYGVRSEFTKKIFVNVYLCSEIPSTYCCLFFVFCLSPAVINVFIIMCITILEIRDDLCKRMKECRHSGDSDTMNNSFKLVFQVDK
jgi:hypothetical protein